ncbi:cytochrome P450 1B1-like [Hemicordylus capensis]|uniref:cytochrome P450 1B1-like n=1 Tax=Hemicordylus capensis TaxID=884348 RepID=UPI002304A123|nr:cytochrome P450 1B1-like [Hemicordylus capensis]
MGERRSPEWEPAALLKSAVQPALLVSCAFLLYLWGRKRPRRAPGKSPPGPVGWPLLGNVLQLGRLPHLTFCELARRYGDVFQLRLGMRAIVVLNGEAAIRQALVQQGGLFAGRPDFPSFHLVSGGKSMAFGRYTERWRAQRRVAHATLRAFSTANTPSKRLFEQHVAAEAQELIDGLVRLSAGGAYVNPAPLLTVANANVMCALCFGQRYSHSDGEFRALLSRNDRFGQTVAAGSLVDVLPWLQAFPNPVRSVFRDFQALNRELHDFVRAKVAQHRRTFQDGAPPRHISDAILERMERGPGAQQQGLVGDYVEGTLTDLFGAGQDTTSTALAWVLLLLLKHPLLRRQLQADLDRVVGRCRLPTADDRASLPRLEAFLYETFRYSSFVPVTIPHATTADVLLDGFSIPEGTVIFVNQWSVNHDRLRWKDPHVFDPTRFLDAPQENLDRDLTCRVMLFSVGKRRCIGDQLAKLQLFLFTAILLHQCELEANPAEELTMDCEHGLALKPLPYTVSVTRRGALSSADGGSPTREAAACAS